MLSAAAHAATTRLAEQEHVSQTLDNLLGSGEVFQQISMDSPTHFARRFRELFGEGSYGNILASW